MPKASRFSGSLHNRVPHIAFRLRSQMQRLGLSEMALARRCEHLAQDLFPKADQPRISRERIAKILMNCKTSPGKSAARILIHQELVVFSRALKVSIEWLIGQEDVRDPVLWDVLAEPERAQQILHLIAENEEKTGELMVWAEGLLGSLTPPEFIHEFHMGQFTELDLLGLTHEKRKLVEVYDNISQVRRQRMFGAKSKRAWTLTQLLFLSELERIADGTSVYQRMSKGLRKRCLENLSRVLADADLGINLVVAKDRDAADIKMALRDYASFGFTGEKFTLWSYHSGKVAWSEHSSHIAKHRQILLELRKCAAYSKREEVLSLLHQLIARIK